MLDIVTVSIPTPSHAFPCKKGCQSGITVSQTLLLSGLWSEVGSANRTWGQTWKAEGRHVLALQRQNELTLRSHAFFWQSDLAFGTAGGAFM